MSELIQAAQRVSDFQLHPLGFFYLQDALGDGSTRRIHVWLPNGPDRPENDRHQHTFDFESFVVTGRIRNELFQFAEEVNGPETEFSVTYEGQRSIVTPSGRRGRLLPIAYFDLMEGASYRLEAGVIHRAAVITRPCITLLKTFDRRIPVFVYGHVEEGSFKRRVCTEEEATQIRHHLLKRAASQ
jgi:hypothetical protein